MSPTDPRVDSRVDSRPDARTVLVTGVADDVGRRAACQLAAAPGVARVVGVDVQPPRGDLGPVQFVRADIRNPVIAKVIVREQVDTVVHLGVLPGSGRSSTKELNVIGTMQLLAGSQQAPDLRHLVVRSSTAVYGASSRDPAAFSEDMTAKRQPRGGFAKDVTEVESYVRGFARRRPDVRVTTLRPAPVIGSGVRGGLSDYFRLPVIPTVVGFDARLQLLHETDLLDAIQHATLADVAGTFNVAGEGVLMLTQAVRRAGRPALPVPAFALSRIRGLFARARLSDFGPEQVAYLTYGCGVDTTRMHEVLGFHPKHTTAEALSELASSLPPGPLSPARVRSTERALTAALSFSGSSRGDRD